ncbi:phage antirepressor N-terminal domain-containing protein [Methylobacterium aquaticum]|uniref:phage antirepressor N-terminal domain-containing protein n=1 Tax=Methylobacterium aquaticum TaxID=270351 RepID=UPI003D17EC3A
MSPHLTTVDFHEDTLFAVDRPDGVFVAIKPIADTLGIDWKAQRNRINRTPILAKGGVMMTLPSPGGPQDMLCLRLDLINGWLFGIDAERVAPEARPRVLAYQEECFAVLHRHFYGRREESGDAPALPAPETISPPLALQMVTEARRTFGVQASRRLWLQLGLPIVAGMAVPPLQGNLFTNADAGPAPAADEVAAG